MIDGKLLELVRLSEVADTHKAQHLLKVVRIKPPKGAKPPSGPGMAAAGVKGGPAAGRKQQPGRIKFREVTLRKTAPEDRIGVLFHRSENEFDMRAFGKFEDGARPIIKKVRRCCGSGGGEAAGGRGGARGRREACARGQTARARRGGCGRPAALLLACKIRNPHPLPSLRLCSGGPGHCGREGGAAGGRRRARGQRHLWADELPGRRNDPHAARRDHIPRRARAKVARAASAWRCLLSEGLPTCRHGLPFTRCACHASPAAMRVDSAAWRDVLLLCGRL